MPENISKVQFMTSGVNEMNMYIECYYTNYMTDEKVFMSRSQFANFFFTKLRFFTFSMSIVYTMDNFIDLKELIYISADICDKIVMHNII